jgi:hypothetical protein
MKVNEALLNKFEAGLNPLHIHKSSIPATIVGYGEISAIFQIKGDEKFVYKRLPLFNKKTTATLYEKMYHEYSDLLIQAGLNLPEHDTRIISAQGRPISLYIIQKKFPGDTLCNHLVQNSDESFSLELIERILINIDKIWISNKQPSQEIELAIDGQLSNWVYLGQENSDKLLYIDTSTPLYRKKGVEQQNPELMLKSAPSFLRWIIRMFFLKDVMTRYYSPKLVFTDLVANLYKEQRSDLVEPVIQLINRFLSDAQSPLTRKEVDHYYREDKVIWRLFLAFRRLDRFLTTMLLRKRYEFILPGKINR